MIESEAVDAEVDAEDADTEAAREMADEAFSDNSALAYARIMRLVAVRDRSVFEMRKRLQDEEFDDDAVEVALEQALNCGLLDDDRFAQAYVRGKLHSRWGRNRIEREIENYGVTLSALDGYPEVFFQDSDEVKRALQELERHRTKAKNVHEARYRRLESKGYAPSVVQKAVQEFERIEQTGDLVL